MTQTSNEAETISAQHAVRPHLGPSSDRRAKSQHSDCRTGGNRVETWTPSERNQDSTHSGPSVLATRSRCASHRCPVTKSNDTRRSAGASHSSVLSPESHLQRSLLAAPNLSNCSETSGKLARAGRPVEGKTRGIASRRPESSRSWVRLHHSHKCVPRLDCA